MSDRAIRRTNRQSADVELIARSVPVLGCLVDDLVERGEYVVGELYLGDRRVAHGSQADGEAHHALLGQRRVEHAPGPVLRAQVNGGAKHATKCNIFAEDATLHEMAMGGRMEGGERRGERKRNEQSS